MKNRDIIIDFQKKIFQEEPQTDIIEYIIKELSEEEFLYVIKDIKLLEKNKTNINRIDNIATIRFTYKKILKEIKKREIDFIHTPLLLEKYNKNVKEEYFKDQYINNKYGTNYIIGDIEDLRRILISYYNMDITIQDIINDYKEVIEFIKEKTDSIKEKQYKRIEILEKEYQILLEKKNKIEELLEKEEFLIEEYLSLKKIKEIEEIEARKENIKEAELIMKKFERHIEESPLMKINNREYNETVKYIKKILTYEGELSKEAEKYHKREYISKDIQEACIVNDLIYPSITI